MSMFAFWEKKDRKNSLQNCRRRLSFEEKSRHQKGRLARLEPLEDRFLLAVVTCGTVGADYTDLGSAIAGAGEGGTVRVITDLANVRLANSVTVTITGWDAATGTAANRTISASASATDQGRVILMNNCTMSLENLTITGGYSDGGGCGGVYVQSGATVYMINCTVTGNTSTAASVSAAVFNQGKAYIINSVITANTATQNNSLGGGISNASGALMAIANSTISNNVIHGEGGGIYNLGAMTIDDCKICNNTATSAGGLYTSGGITIYDSIITQNTATSYAGGICVAGLTEIYDSVISKNNANGGVATGVEADQTNQKASGGAIVIRANGKLKIERCQIVGNYGRYFGGAISTYAMSAISTTSLHVNNTVIANNWASYQGGAFGNYDASAITFGTYTFVNVSFIGNVGEQGYGSTVTYRGNCLQFLNCLFIKNLGGSSPNDTTGSYGLVIDDTGAYDSNFVNFSSSSVTNTWDNSRHESWNLSLKGTAYFMQYRSSTQYTSNKDVAGNDFSSQTTVAAGAYQGSTLTITSATEEEFADYLRRAFWNNVDIVIGAEMTVNIATTATGDTSLYSLSSLAADNIYTKKSLSIKGSEGKALTLTGGSTRYFEVASDYALDLDYVNINGAKALYGQGGAVKCAGTFKASNVSFTNCSGFNGGAIFLTGAADSVISACSFNDNKATTGRGGALYSQTTGTCAVSNGTFNNNTAATDGGAIAAIRGAVTLSGALSGNSSSANGGAVYINGDTNAYVTLNSTANYTSNSAKNGGGIWAGQYSGLNVTGGNFASNSATEADGGAILTWSRTASAISDANFSGNTAVNVGGAIACYRTLTVAGCNIGGSGGNSANYGGGIFTAGVLTLSGDTITNNSAAKNGGGISVGYYDDNTGAQYYGSLAAGDTDTYVYGNTASNRGGGLLIGAQDQTNHGTVGTPGNGSIRIYNNTDVTGDASRSNIVSVYVTATELSEAHITTAASAELPNTPQSICVMSDLEAITIQDGTSAVLPVSGTYLYDFDNDGVFDYESGSILTSAELADLGFTPGTYQITVALTDAEGNPDAEFTYQSVLTIEAAAAPSVDCKVNSYGDGALLNLNIAVSGNAAAIAQWTINWGDGQTSVIDSLADSIVANHLYTALGTYDVTLQMVDTNGQGEGSWGYLTTNSFNDSQEDEICDITSHSDKKKTAEEDGWTFRQFLLGLGAEDRITPDTISVTDTPIAPSASKAEIALYWDNADEESNAIELPVLDAVTAAFDETEAIIFAEVPALESAAPTLNLVFADASGSEDEEDEWFFL